MNAEQFEKWLKDKNACEPGLTFARGMGLQETYLALERPEWLTWLIRNLGYGDKKLYVRLAIAAAQMVSPSKTGKVALSAAEAWLDNPNEENRRAAQVSSKAAYEAAFDIVQGTSATVYAADVAAYAADSACAEASASAYAINVKFSATYAVDAATYAAIYAATYAAIYAATYAATDVFYLNFVVASEVTACSAAAASKSKEICDKWREVIGPEIDIQG